MNSKIAGLYAITPDLADTDDLLYRVRAALAGGARVVQYRNKTADSQLRLTQARILQALCTVRGVPLIINDHLDVALAVDAAGLHLGGERFDKVRAGERVDGVGHAALVG